MTRKAISKQLDALIAAVAAAHGVTDFAARPGIDPRVHMINGKVFEALDRFAARLVAATQPPAPPATPAVPEGWGEVGGVEETAPAVAA